MCVYIYIYMYILFPQLRWLLVLIAQATLYPGLCEPTSQGGLGFDYFVNLSVPDMWLSFLQGVPDHEWRMSKVVPCDSYGLFPQFSL